ncbi:MAG: hypothetical protein ACOC22_01140 [bacterium]
MEKTAQEVVELLNEKLHGVDAEHEDNFMNFFTYETNGMYEAITLRVYVEDFEIKLSIWNSEADDREFNEELNEYEPLEEYIIKIYDSCVEKLIELRKFFKNV